MRFAIWFLAAIALAQASPVAAQGMRLTYQGGLEVGGDFEVDVQSSGDGNILTRTSHRLAPDWKSGEAPRFVTQTHQINSERCPAAVKALERLEALDLPNIMVLVKVTANGGVIIPVLPVDVGRYTLAAPTGPQAGGRVQLSGYVHDPVGLWFMNMMKAIEPCWETQSPVGPTTPAG